MTRNDFRLVLQAAMAGEHKALEEIIDMYEPLINKYCFVDGEYDEDLHQYILIRIALKISKFNI